ncbi:MAG: CRISPR-associated protein Csx17 [Actinomycetota bacterium]|nr:CRISPR-associated protein Csx17 [Actinomycetota bacterium]
MTTVPPTTITSPRFVLPLDGCRPVPLGSYLQGLGVWHAVTRLLDPGALACWRSGHLVLTTRITQEELAAGLLERFAPLPIVSPWNSGSGFAGNGKSKEAERALATIEASADPRLAVLRDTIIAARAVIAEGQARGWGGTKDRLWDDAAKADVVRLCRNLLPDQSLPWIDATISITQDGSGQPSLEFNRLLGTGGNFGRQDLQSTYLQRALTVLTDRKAAPNNPGWLRAVLFGEEGTPYLRETVGQFDPGRAGGIQSSPAEKADSDGFANPWAFLFMIEGALFFAGSASRRLGVGTANASLPFVVRPSNVGYGSSAEAEKVMAEVWTPQWPRPASLAETRQLFSEARVAWNGSMARSGLDVARAIVSGGVDRGIERFERHVIAERLGQNPLAVHVDSVVVRHRAGVSLTGQLDRWVEALRRLQSSSPGLPQAAAVELRALREALYACSLQDGRSLVQVLSRAGRLHGLIARSGRLREALRPLVLEHPGEWIEAICHTVTPWPQLRVAVALASGWSPDGTGNGTDPPRGWHSPLRLLLTPVGMAGTRLSWSGRPPIVASSDLPAALADVLRRRAQAHLPDPAAPVDAGFPLTPAVQGHPTCFSLAIPAELSDVQAFLTGVSWKDQEFTDLLHAFLLFRWSIADQAGGRAAFRAAPTTPAGDEVLPDPLLALLMPFQGRASLQVRWRDEQDAEPVLLRPDDSWPSELAAGHLTEVARTAALRLRIAGARSVISPETATRPWSENGRAGVLGRRLAAALLVPVSDSTRARCLTRVTDAARVSPRTPAGTRPTDTTSTKE